MIIRPEIGEDVTMEFASVAREMNKKNIDIISFGLGEPDFSTPKHIIDASKKALDIDPYRRYSNPLGLYELRKEISIREKKVNKTEINPENIIVTPGVKQALFLSLLSTLEPEDEIINFSPSYVCYIPDIYLAEPNAVIKNIRLKNDFTIDIDELKNNITDKTKVILINSPHNPTGKMISKIERDEIAKIAIDKNIYIISDEIYDLMCFSGKEHFGFGSINELKDLIITVNGFSKSYSMTGWRIGYAIAPPHLINTMRKIQLHTNTNTCGFIQMGAIEALRGDHSHLTRFNSELIEKVKIMTKYLGKDVMTSPTEGGFFSFLNISKTGLSSNAFSAQFIKECRVATSPGIAFGKEWDTHIRVSLIENVERFRKGIVKLASFISKYEKINKRV